MNKITKVNLKNYLLLLFLFVGFGSFGQSGPTLEFSAVDKPQPDFPGATDEVTVRMSQNIDNPTNNNFATYDPAVEVTFSLDNYQIPYATPGKIDYWGNTITDMNAYGNRAINFGYVRETTNLTNDAGAYIVGGVPANPYNKVSTYGFSTSNATSSSYTSANNPIGQGFDINENYGVQLSMLPYALAGPTANNGSPYNLEGRYYVADLTITFSRPVNNPVLHFAGMGMGINTLRTTGTASERRNYSGYHGWSLEYDFIGNSNLSLTKLSGNDHFDVNSNSIVNNKEYIYTNTQGNYAEGSVQFMGTGITELKFKVFLRSDPGTNGDGSGPYPNIVGGVSQLTKAYAAWGEGSNLSGSGNEAKRVAARTGRGNYASISVSLPLAHISGNVFEDTDGDTSINGTGTNGDGLYVNLLDADGNVAKSVAVASDGSYDLGAVDLHSGYQLQLTKNQGTVGAPAPTTELNDNWSTVGESFETTGNDGTPDGLLNLDDYSGDMTKANITTANFGIKMLNPDQDDCTNSGITSVDLNSLFTGTLPDPTVVLQWWTSPNRDLDALNPGTKVDDPTNVTESGTYYVFFYDTVNDCYNTDNSTSFVNVNILPPCDINTCVTGDCNPNTFINAVDPNTLEYDNMVSVFHSSMVREADGTIRIWGQGAMPNGYSNGSSTGSVGNVLTPIEVSPANGYNYSGKILRFTAGSNQYNQQFAILTTDGLYSWGDQGVLLHADLQPRGEFTKLAVGTYGIAGTKADGLPAGVNPEDVKMLFGMRNGMAIVTCTGEAWVLSNITQLYGDGITSSSANQVWHRVSTAADTPLENVVAIRGAYGNMVALTASGELYTWGRSTLLGDGTASATRTYATLMTKPAGVTPKMIGMTRSASSSGDEMSYYLLATDGKLYSMGANDKRQLGNGTTTRTTTWGEVTATDATTGEKLGGNIVWLSPQEHDGNQDYPAVSVLTDQGKLWAWGTNDGNMLGIPGGDHTGNDPTYMPGRTTGAYDETKLNESDEVIAVETGGHTSIIIKKCTIKFGYVGHRINGSMADGTTDAANEGIYNFSETSQLAVCGALTSPKIPELLEICPDEVQDLTAVQTILPAEVTGIQWYHDMNATVPVSNPSEVGPGTYYAFYELAGGTIHDCPSRLVVSYYATNDPNSPCYCVEPGIPGEPDGYTLTGVSDLEGFNEGWPNNVPNGFIAIESKTQGFVITRVAHVGGTDGTPDASDAISNPVEGMLVYDIQDACVKLFNGTTWNCLSRTCNDPVFRLDCSNATTTGDTHGPDVNFTITVPYFNGDGSAYAAQTIESINAPGLNATLEAGNLANGNGNLTITVTGTVVSGGPAYFELMVNGDTCVVISQITISASEV